MYEICVDSERNKTKQIVKARKQPRPGWELAREMHATNATKIDRASEQRAARAEKRRNK